MKKKIPILFLLICVLLCLVACKTQERKDTEAELSVPISTLEVEKCYERQASLDNETAQFRDYYAHVVSDDEYKIIDTALAQAPTQKLRSAQAYLIVLLHAIQETEYSEIQIASAKVIAYPLAEKNRKGDPYAESIISLEKNYGCDEYALEIVDAAGNEFIVWDSFVYEKVFCNGEEIRSYYHVMF